MGGGRLAAVAAFALLGADGAGAADLVIDGCNERLAGEIGIRELAGDVGETVSVNVTMHTTGPVDAMVLEIEVPPGVVDYVGTAPGELTQGFTFGGNWFAAASKVRIVASNPNPIPAGTVGRIAEITFLVTAPGSGDAFVLGNFLDDAAAYVSCFDVHGPTPVEAASWGRVKARYGSDPRGRAPEEPGSASPTAR
jgi:hypothetical protein